MKRITRWLGPVVTLGLMTAFAPRGEAAAPGEQVYFKITLTDARVTELARGAEGSIMVIGEKGRLERKLGNGLHQLKTASSSSSRTARG